MEKLVRAQIESLEKDCRMLEGNNLTSKGQSKSRCD